MARTSASTTGRVEGGRLLLRSRRVFDAELADIPDGDVIVLVEKVRAARSLAQNRYWWGVVVKMIAATLGKTAQETHELLAALHFPRDVAATTGNGTIVEEGKYVIGARTSKLTAEEFARFTDAVIIWAAETLRLVIPDPDPEYFIHRTKAA